jgi:hypothetical protein
MLEVEHKGHALAKPCSIIVERKLWTAYSANGESVQPTGSFLG